MAFNFYAKGLKSICDVPVCFARDISRGLDIKILVSIIHEVQYRVIQGCARNQIPRGFRETRSTNRYVTRGINGVHYDDLCKAHDRSRIIARRCIDDPRWLRESMRVITMDVNTDVRHTQRASGVINWCFMKCRACVHWARKICFSKDLKYLTFKFRSNFNKIRRS